MGNLFWFTVLVSIPGTSVQYSSVPGYSMGRVGFSRGISLIPNLTSDQIFFSFFLSSYFLPVLINSLFRSTLHMQIWRSGKLLAEYSNTRLLPFRSIHIAKYLQGSSVQPEQASCETKKIKKNSTTSSTNFSSTAFVVSTSRFVQRKRRANNTTSKQHDGSIPGTCTSTVTPSGTQGSEWGNICISIDTNKHKSPLK